MPRRKAYTKVYKKNQIREDHVSGMGDVPLKGFQCLNPKCQEFIFVKELDTLGEFIIKCSKCGFVLHSGGATKFYDYELKNIDTGELVEQGSFEVSHDDYLKEAKYYKYCIICNTIKPYTLFDNHSSRQTGKQGECRLCKTIYNNIKNQTRITDQHRESAQKRRMYSELAGNAKIDSQKILERFDNKCFKCGKDLSKFDIKEANLDHTLPVYYLWSLTTKNATLLCKTHNSEKSGKWPSEYYTVDELKRLSIITGIDYALLSGKPVYNPKSIKKLQTPEVVDRMLTKYSAYLDEITKLRNRLIRDINFDFFKYSKLISSTHIDNANNLLKK